ncbi:hypothetical protein [Spirillospora sp. NPDC047279]|uniref:hypothetical protein n=1 Tax=Spirillospora sp. NPDC047279 TaxID=3155478 RepID=UPI0033C39EDE
MLLIEVSDLSDKRALDHLAGAIDIAERELTEKSRTGNDDDRAQRRAVDQRLIELLREDDFAGDRFNRLAREMVAYGFPIMMKWLNNGEIFAKAQKCRCQFKRHSADLDWTADDRYQIAIDTLLEGVELFRRQLRLNRWDPDKGASLKTFYVGACVCAFCKAYGVWRREQILTDGVVHIAYAEDLEAQKVAARPRVVDPEEHAVVQDLVDRAIKPMDPGLRHVVGLRALGYTQKEAAAEVELTEKAAERRLARYRRKHGNHDAADPASCDGGTGER